MVERSGAHPNTEGVFVVSAENFRDITGAELDAALACVKHGYDEVAATNLIRYFALAIRDDVFFQSVELSAVERIFIEFVGMGFGRYSEANGGKSLQSAFGLSRSRGQRISDDPLATEERDMQIAAFVILRMRDSVLYINAIEDAADRFFSSPDGKGSRACKDAYERFKDVMIRMPSNELESMMP